MVTMDDQTYAQMRDTIYKWDEQAASKKRQEIETSYDEDRYNRLKTNMGIYADQQAQKTITPETPTPAKQETPVKQTETPVNTVTEIKQEWALKPQSQEYYNQTSDEALNVIKNNLNQYKQTNPEYFTNYEDFKKNFSYNYRNEQQKQVLDQFYQWYEKWLQLWATPVNDLYTQYKDGQISLSDLEILKTNNPVKYTELQNQINKASILAAYDDTTPTEKTNLQDMAYEYMAKVFNQFMNGDYTSEASQYFTDYKNNMNNPEMLELQDKTTELQEQAKNIQDDIYSMQKEVEEEYKGTWATRSKINAIIADRTYDLQQQLRTINNEYEKYATQYNNRATQYQNEFQLQLQEYQINMQARNQQMSELWFAMDLMSFETPQQAQERQWDYWVKQQEYTNWNINSSDYSTRHKAALKSVENLLSQYDGIPMKRSAEQMADDILKAIDNWSTLGEELTKLNQQIQSKPEYKQLYNATYGGTTASWMIQDSFKVWDTEWVKYNGQRMTADQFNSMMTWTGTAKPYDVVSEDMFRLDNSGWLWGFLFDSKNTITSTWGQCGHFVNNYLEKIWVGRYYDDNLSTKLNSVNTDKNSPKVWTIAVFDYNHKSSDWINHGHVWIVTQVFKDWSFTVLDSNFDWDEKIQLRTIRPWSSSLKWFFDPSKWPSSTNKSVSSSNLTSEEEAIKKTALAELSYWFLTPTKIAEYGEMAAKQGWDEEWRDAMNQNRWVNMTQDQSNKSISLNDKFASRDAVKDYKDAVVQLEKLITSASADNWVWDMAAVFTFMKTLDPSSVVREWEFNSAAKTAWVLNPQALWQKVERLTDWEILTPSQRKDFINIAKEYVKSHSKAYELEYKDLQNQYEVQWIPEKALPINWVDYVEDMIDDLWWATSSKNNVSALNTVKSSLDSLSANMKSAQNKQTNTKATVQSLFWVQ